MKYNSFTMPGAWKDGSPAVQWVEECYLTGKRAKSCECNTQPCIMHDRDYNVIRGLIDAYHSLWRLYMATQKDLQSTQLANSQRLPRLPL